MGEREEMEERVGAMELEYLLVSMMARFSVGAFEGCKL